MADFGKINGHQFSKTSGNNGDIFRRVNGIWVPSSVGILNAADGANVGQSVRRSAAGWETFTPAAADPGFIYSSATEASVTNAATDQVAYQFTLPGGTVPPNGAIILHSCWGSVGTTSKTVRIRVGGTNVYSNTYSTSNSFSLMKAIFNRANNTLLTGAANLPGSGNVAPVPVSFALDWTQNQVIDVLATVVTAPNGVNFSFFAIEVKRP